MNRETILSADRLYRYSLWRQVHPNMSSYALFLGVNPSTADERFDDPTIRRDVGFTRSLGYGWMCKANLFAYRATQPADMKAQADPVGPDNDKWIVELATGASLIVCAWGVNGIHQDRDAAVLKLLRGFDIYHLGLTKGGQPKHPLYLRADTLPTLWRGAA